MHTAKPSDFAERTWQACDHDSNKIRRFRIHKEQQGRWVLKTFDFFEVCKLCFGSSCSLNSLLLANGYEVKISHGRQAVIWAREKNWKSLEEYCMKDAVLTYQISMSPHVRTPLSRWPGSVRVACIREPPMHGSGTNNGIGTSAQLRHASEALPHAAQEGAADDPSCMSHQGCKLKRPAALSLAVTTATPVECPGKPIPVACPLPEKLNQLGCGTAPREPWPCIHLEAAVAPGHGASV